MSICGPAGRSAISVYGLSFQIMAGQNGKYVCIEPELFNLGRNLSTQVGVSTCDVLHFITPTTTRCYRANKNEDVHHIL